MARFASIQVLRAVAALGVVSFHLLPARFPVGAAGVDIFFVISGFIMGTIGAQEAPSQFILKRIIRIVPLYWLVTLAMCLISLVPGVFRHFAFDLPTLLKSLLFIPYVDRTGHVWPLLVSGWTLDYEMLFYAVFAIGLTLRRPARLAAVLMMALVAAGWLCAPADPVLRSWTDPLLLEFAAGLLLARGRFIRGVPLGLALLLLGAAGFAGLGLWSAAAVPRALAWGLPAFALVAGAVAVERAGCWPRLPPVERVGDASYSLYLLHALVIDAVRRLLPGNLALELAASLAGSVLVAFAGWHLIERPAARFLQRQARRSSLMGAAAQPAGVSQ